jgi:hypothetical protein
MVVSEISTSRPRELVGSAEGFHLPGIWTLKERGNREEYFAALSSMPCALLVAVLRGARTVPQAMAACLSNHTKRLKS